MGPAEEESSETAHSSAEDEPADDLAKATESHHYSCGLEVHSAVRYGTCMLCERS